jgi:hypothetical protein
LLDELARYDVELDNKRVSSIKRLFTLGYTAQQIASAINPRFVWNEEHGRLDARE